MEGTQQKGVGRLQLQLEGWFSDSLSWRVLFTLVLSTDGLLLVLLPLSETDVLYSLGFRFYSAFIPQPLNTIDCDLRKCHSLSGELDKGQGWDGQFPLGSTEHRGVVVNVAL